MLGKLAEMVLDLVTKTGQDEATSALVDLVKSKVDTSILAEAQLTQKYEALLKEPESQPEPEPVEEIPEQPVVEEVQKEPSVVAESPKPDEEDPLAKYKVPEQETEEPMNVEEIPEETPAQVEEMLVAAKTPERKESANLSPISQAKEPEVATDFQFF